MPNVLITGANRGLGLEFAKQYSDDGWNVVTTIREPSPELDSLGVQIEHLDMADLNAVASFGERLNALDLLVANAGTYGPKEATNAEDAEAWLDTIRINTVAPYLLARSVQPLVEANRGKLIAVSTKMGSIEDDGSGGFLRLPFVQDGAQHGVAQPCARCPTVRRSRSDAPPWLGTDADGRKLGAARAGGKHCRHAPRHRRTW